jgi:hypothetical protein
MCNIALGLPASALQQASQTDRNEIKYELEDIWYMVFAGKQTSSGPAVPSCSLRISGTSQF